MTATATRITRPKLTTAPLGHIEALDGLRAIAVAAVCAYHAGFDWIGGGFLGVSAFFTLSGFLITSLLLREWASSAASIDMRRFWRRRFRRLLPASWATMALVLVAGAVGVWNTDQLRSLRSDIPYGIAEIINWHFIAQDRSYGASFTAPSPLEHFWSLAVEQQSYVALGGYAGSLNHAVAGVSGASRVQGGEGRVVRHRTSSPSALVVHPGR